MKRIAVLFGSIIVIGALCACDALIGRLIPRLTTVRLVNNSDFPIDVELFIHDDQEVLEAIITEAGTQLDFTISAGESRSFTRDCDELQAILIENADLRVIGGAGPDASTDVLRDGSDFSCGETVIFTFDHSENILDFDVTVRTEPAAIGEIGQ